VKTVLLSEPAPDAFSLRSPPSNDVSRNVVTIAGVALSVGTVLSRGKQPFKYLQLTTPVGNVGLHVAPAHVIALHKLKGELRRGARQLLSALSVPAYSWLLRIRERSASGSASATERPVARSRAGHQRKCQIANSVADLLQERHQCL
jgi:hypothetical protein